MLFNSFAFLLAFPVAAVIYSALRLRFSRAVSQGWLLLCSLGFYSFNASRQLPLLLGSIIFNWAIARRAGDPTLSPIVRWRWMIGGVAANILFLSLFKYVNFFLAIFQPLFGVHVALPDWGLPLGISFFTLTQVMYLVDCYEELVSPNTLFDHATFVTFFPYLVAGPLSRARLIVQQFHDKAHTVPDAEEVARGFALFTLGLIKKTVFADSLVRLADTAFAAPQSTSALETWISVLAYWMQIYFDFSGYSDMAVGGARMLGYTIPFNFRAPYQSLSIIEFWQRWHISLSNFITTYLYTPILRSFGGRATVAKAAVASILAMTIVGQWHGPAITFVVYGLCHGVALATNQYSRKVWKLKVPDWAAWGLTMLFVMLSDIIFRSTSLGNAAQVARHLVPTAGFAVETHLSISLTSPEVLSFLLPSTLAVPLAIFGPASQDMVAKLRPTLRTSFAYASLAFISLIFMNSILAKPFLYFGF